MMSTRMKALIFVLLLVGGLSLIGVVATAYLGPISAHGTNVMHVGGKVIKVGPDRNFEFKTAAGETMNFICNGSCRASVGHLQRHLKEGATTDVYYIQGPNNELLVVDVD